MSELKRQGRVACGLAVVLVLAGYALPGMCASFPGEKDMWEGYDRYNFEVDGRKCFVVTPKEEAEGRPWIWRARFWGHRPELDIALLGKGFHLVYMDVANLYGSPKAVGHWDAFYAFLTKEHGFSEKAVLEGMSRGGLIVYNWAAKHPERVACIYADAPVMDFKSWPGGKGSGKGSPDDWQRLLGAYGFKNEEEALAYDKNPLDQAKPLAKEKMPIFHVCGGADEVVPYDENTRIFKRRYAENGGTRFYEFVKPDVGHVHGLDFPAALVHFVLRNTIEQEENPPDAVLPGFEDWGITDFAGRRDVRVEGGALFLEMGHDMTGVTWKGEDLPRMNYEISLEAMRVAGDDFFCGLTFPYGADPCTLVVGGWGGTCVGLSCLDYNDAYNNETARFMEFDKGKWYPIRLRVTESKIEAWIGDKKLVDTETEDRHLSIRWECEKSQPLGICSWQTTAAIRNFKLTHIVP